MNDFVKPRFASFFMAGFECAYGQYKHKKRLDLLRATKHDELCAADYQLLKKQGIKTTREGLAWHQIDHGKGDYDFSRFENMMKIAQREGVQQIWDLNHFDYPADLNPFTPAFVERFARYAEAAIKVIRRYQNGELYIVPINEISFFSWIGADRGWWPPYKTGPEMGFKFKKQLVRASIAAMDAMWRIDKNIRFIQVDPYMFRLAKEPASPTAKKIMKDFNEKIRFETWDLLSGKRIPELGGNPKYLDIIGVNYYFMNQQWLISSPKWKKVAYRNMAFTSKSRLPFSVLLQEIYNRYGRPMVITETGSYGDLRPKWWKKILGEIDDSLDIGLPIYGVCAYPTVDRPDWTEHLGPRSGLWDFDQSDTTCMRIPHQATLEILKPFISKWQVRVG